MPNQSWRKCVKNSWLNKEVKGVWFYVLFIVLIISVTLIFPVKRQNVQPEQKKVTTEQIESNTRVTGLATYYDYDLNRKDQKCLTNDCYSMFHSTCASREFKRGTILKVTNLDNLKSVECRVNDYGPEEWTGKRIDLSSYTFNKISALKIGVINVEITVIK